MLPALKPSALSLADVLPSCLAALRGEGNALGLPVVRSAVVVLVDGLGQRQLSTLAGHARRIAAAAGKGASIDSGWPSTTASALATLTTGERPGVHGMVGYSVRDPETGTVDNQLSGLHDPAWQRSATVFERAVDAGLRARVVAAPRYRDTVFTRAVLRGAEFHAGAGMADRVRTVLDLLDAPGEPQLIYLYIPELDQAAHAHGADSSRYVGVLEELDAALAPLLERRDAGVVLTADHGLVDVPPHSQVLFDTVPELMSGIAAVAGEPRCLQLYFAEDADETTREATVAAWRASEGARSWVATRAEAIESGWFGEVDPSVLPRIGDLIVAARKLVAYYASDASAGSRAMIGQHGSLTQDELRVPLLRFGAFSGR